MPMIEFNEKQYKSIRQLSLEVNIPYTTLLHRLDSGKTLTEAVRAGSPTQNHVTVAGQNFKSITQAAEFFGVKANTARSRLKNGFTVEEAFGLKKRQKKKKNQETCKNPVTVNGVKYGSLFQAARSFNLSTNMVNKRVKKGLTIEQALELEPFPDWFTPGKGQHAIKRKQKRIEEENKTGLKTCSVCKKQKPLDKFHIASKTEKSCRCRDCTSEAFLRYRYKISVSQFWDFYNKQKGACAICEVNFNLEYGSTWRSKLVAVDHCHETGVVRGILCSSCNQGLGMFRDSANLMMKAIKYLGQSA